MYAACACRGNRIRVPGPPQRAQIAVPLLCRALTPVATQVVVEVAVAFVLVLLGALVSAGPLKRADAVGKSSDTRYARQAPSCRARGGALTRAMTAALFPIGLSSLDAFFARPDFQVFNHRMRAFRSRFAEASGAEK